MLATSFRTDVHGGPAPDSVTVRTPAQAEALADALIPVYVHPDVLAGAFYFTIPGWSRA